MRIRSLADDGAPARLAALTVALSVLVTSLLSVRAAPNCDVLCARVRADLAVFTDWLSDHGVDGFIGEVGWPDDIRGDGASWNALADVWFRDADAAELPVTVWATGEWWGDYKLAPYRSAGGAESVGVRNVQAGVVERYSSNSPFLRGINLAGGEFGAPDDEATSPFSNANPGSYGVDYRFPSADTFEYLASRGLRLVRLPFRWERIQPSLGGPLDSGELGRLSQAVEYAGSAGLEVVLDMHNYGGYYLFDGAKGVRRGLGSDQVTKDMFADVWRRLSARFAGSEAVYAYGLMNEPVGIGEAAGLDPARRWEIISQAAVNAIRSTGDDTTVMVGGYDWSGVRQWTTHHPRPWISDSADRIRYEAHHYWDRDRSGTYSNTYAEEVETTALGA